jgi:hypothetical protein
MKIRANPNFSASVRAATPISTALERLDESLSQLHGKLEVLGAKLTPILHSQPPQQSTESVPASDVGLVRQIDEATGRVLLAVRELEDLTDRVAV